MFSQDKEQFYPTPKVIAQRLFSMCPGLFEDREHKGEKFTRTTVHSIFEPSAGMGDLIKHFRDYLNDGCKWPAFIVNNHSDYVNLKVEFAEINDEFVEILREKGYVHRAYDFNDLKDTKIYADAVIMNPPFREGVGHLLQVINNLVAGKVFAILSADSVRRDIFSARYLRKKLEELGATIEYHHGAFDTDETKRKTKVEVALIHFEIKREDDGLFDDFEHQEEAADQDFVEISDTNQVSIKEGPLSLKDRLFNEIKEDYLEAAKSFIRMRKKVDALGINEYNKVLDNFGKVEPNQKSLNTQMKNVIDNINSLLWRQLFNNPVLEGKVDSKTAENYQLFVEQKSSLVFTEAAAIKMITTLLANQDMFQKNAIETAFEFLTKYHDDNREPLKETWKTNDGFQVKKKFILPYGVRYNDWTEYFRFEVPYHEYVSKWSDIDLALKVVTGRLDDSTVVGIQDAIYLATTTPSPHPNDKTRMSKRFVHGVDKTFKAQSTFFDIRFYKKGTVHCTFRDEEVRARFNRFACEGRNWIKPSKENPNPNHKPQTVNVIKALPPMFDGLDEL